MHAGTLIHLLQMSLQKEHLSSRSAIHSNKITRHHYVAILVNSIGLLFVQYYSVYSDEFEKAREAYGQKLKTSKLFAELMSIVEV